MTGDAPPPTTRQRAGRRRRAAVVSVAILAAGAVWGGCSIEKNYDLLTFFFDGVPAPGALGPAGTGPGLGPAAAPIVLSAHQAFEQRRCNECHGDTAGFGLVITGFSDLDVSTCLECHEPVMEAYPRLHGPVAAKECLWCHQPHESRYPHLLVSDSTTLCLGCHGFELRTLPQPPEHEDLARDCLDCHWGHGRAGPYFLKALDGTE